MRTVKQFPIGAHTQIVIPNFSKVLSAQVQDNQPVLYIEVTTDFPMVKRFFALFETGEELPMVITYIGTIKMPGTGKEYHAYEVTE